MLAAFIFPAYAQALTLNDLTAELAALEATAQNISAEIVKAKNNPQTTTAALDKLLVDVQTVEARTQTIRGLLVTAPSAPIVTASPLSSCGGNVSLSYTPSVSGTVVKYDLNRNPDGTQTASWGVVAQGTDIKIFPAIDQGLKPDTIYKYQLRAVGPGDIEAFSEIVQAKSSVACPPPPPPVCAAPLTQNVTGIECDPKNGIAATSGSVTRSQIKSAYPSCTFGTPVTAENSKYESDTCVYTPVTYELKVSTAGNGNVTSAPAGINCGSDCSESYTSGTSVTLTASPAGGWRFVTWSGACSNMTGNCVVAMNGAKNVTANFSLNPVDLGGSSSTTIINTTPPPAVVTTTPSPTAPTPPATTQPPASTNPPANATPPPAATIPPATTTPTGTLSAGGTTAAPSGIVLGATPGTAGLPPPTSVSSSQVTPGADIQRQFQNGLVPCGKPATAVTTVSGKTYQVGQVIPCDFNSFMKLIDNIMKFILFSLAVPIAALMFAYAGFKLVTSGGSAEAKTRAKTIFFHAVLGIVIAAGAWLIVKTILDILGYQGDWIGF